jgi:Flp pilus assembly protein CpaB
LPFWGAAVVLAVLTAVSLSGVLAKADRFGPVRPVVVVQRPVRAGAVVGDADVGMAGVPGRFVPVGAVARRSSVVGRAALVDLMPGEVVVGPRMAGLGVAGVAALVPPGRRGISVPAGDGGVPVRVGDRVDVLATFEGEAGLGGAGGVAPTAPTVAVARGALVVDVREGAVTVAAVVAEVPRLAFALARGTVVLALVPPPTR